MSRITPTFERLKSQDRAAMIPFFTAGDPDPSVTVPMLHALAEAGADLIEIGVPFSDPMADGPAIQKANERALLHHLSLRQVLQAVAEFRQSNQHTPLILMGYLNPIEVMGYAAFAEAAAQAGVDAVIAVDMPPEESEDLVRELRQHNLDMIFLLAPSSDATRVQRVMQQASGFVYYVSMYGVTGKAGLDVAAVQQKLDWLRPQSHLPIGVGFGIQDAQTAAAVAAFADAVVVGSVLVKQIAQAHNAAEAVERAAALVREIAAAVHMAERRR